MNSELTKRENLSGHFDLFYRLVWVAGRQKRFWGSTKSRVSLQAIPTFPPFSRLRISLHRLFPQSSTHELDSPTEFRACGGEL